MVIELVRRGTAAVLLGLVVAACGSTPSPSPSPDPLAGVQVAIGPGLSPQLRPVQVAELVIRQIHSMERLAGVVLKAPRILKMTATTTAGVGQLEPGAGQPLQPEPGIEWLVRAEGTFTSNRGPVAGAAGTAESGYFIISDVDGGVIGFGYP